MDEKDIQSDLHALKRLYGLLQKDGGAASNTSSDSLDEHSRLFLKNLLDLATKRVLKTHSEVIAGKPEASGSLSPARLQQPDDAASEGQPTPHSSLSIAVGGDQGSDGPDWSQEGAVEQSIDRVPAIGLKRCRICRRNTFKRRSTGDVARNNVHIREKEIGLLSSNRSNDSKCEKWRQSDSNIIADADIITETISKHEEPDCLSKEASKAIQQIELCMSALNLFERTSSTQSQNHVPETESVVHRKYDAVPSVGTTLGQRFEDDFVYPIPRTKTEEGNQASKAVLKQLTTNIIQSKPVSKAGVLDMLEESTDECRFPRKKVNTIYVQNMNAIMEKVEPVNWIMSSNGVALFPNEASYVTPCWPATSFPSSMESPCQSRIILEDGESKPSSVSFTNQKNHPPRFVINKKTNGPSVVSGFQESQLDVRDRVGVRKDMHYTTAAKRTLQNQCGTTTDSYSDWSSHQTSSRDSNSEDYSVTNGSTELHYVSSSKSTRSWDSTPSHGSGSPYRSFSEEEVYSSSSADGACANSSSGNDGYLSYEEPIRSHARPKHFASKKSAPSKIEKAYSNKESGIWKRLKNKVAVVFHHHHHHHHHHNRTNDETKNMSLNSSLDKHKGKAINPRRQDEEYRAKGFEKIGKSQIHERRRQQNNFQELVGGLVRHVRHLKQSKEGKGTSDKLVKEYGRKKSVKKSHWWQVLQHHHRSKKANLKVGLGKKKHRLKALPTIK